MQPHRDVNVNPTAVMLSGKCARRSGSLALKQQSFTLTEALVSMYRSLGTTCCAVYGWTTLP